MWCLKGSRAVVREIIIMPACSNVTVKNMYITGLDLPYRSLSIQQGSLSIEMGQNNTHSYT